MESEITLRHRRDTLVEAAGSRFDVGLAWIL